MAVEETRHPNAPRIDRALPLLDFDWKLKYAVASGSIAAVNKPLLRLELYVSKSLSKVEEAGLGRVLPENQIQTSIAEFTKAQLDTFIGAMDAIEQHYIDAAKAEEEADRIASMAGRNLKEVLNSFRDCLQVVHSTRRMLEVDPECICVNRSNSDAKWERRKELHEAACSIEDAMEILLQTSLNEIEASMVDTLASDGSLDPEDEAGKLGRYQLEKFSSTVEEDDLLWCDHVCVHENVDMDGTLWCNMPHTLLELVFARLPLHQIFQLRILSKHWQSLITSPTFQSAFGTTASHRFGIIAGTERKRLWSFGTMERRWYTLPFDFLPRHYDVPIAGDGGLLCCRRPASFTGRVNQVNCVQDLQLYVCNPLTRTWRNLPLPSQVQAFNLVHLVTDRHTKQYTITVVDDLQSSDVKARVEVYDSRTNTWKTGEGIFQSAGTSRDNLVYYKKYMAGEFVGIRAYDKNTGYTSVLISVQDGIFFSEARGFFPIAEYQGRIYVLQSEVARSGIWELQGPSHKWEKVCSVPKPEVLKFYLFSLYVSGDVIVIFGEKRIFHDDINLDILEDNVGELENAYRWMLDRSQGKWIDMVDHELDCISFSEIMFEMRLDGIP